MTDPAEPQPTPPNAAGRFVAAVFGVAFAGIGLTVIGFLWFGEDGFHEPPVFFKLFGSFIAMVFVAVGGAAVYGAIAGGGPLAQAKRRTQSSPSSMSAASPGGGYTCPHCGGGLDRGADVSPMGDVKCSFCGRWFNVHGRS